MYILTEINFTISRILIDTPCEKLCRLIVITIDLFTNIKCYNY